MGRKKDYKQPRGRPKSLTGNVAQSTPLSRQFFSCEVPGCAVQKRSDKLR